MIYALIDMLQSLSSFERPSFDNELQDVLEVQELGLLILLAGSYR